MRRSIIVVVAIALGAGSFGPGWDLTAAEQQISPEADELIREILGTKAPEELVVGHGGPKYRRLFKLVGDDGLKLLLTHPNDSIAIQAGWQEVALTVPEQESRSAYRPNHDKLQWFLGFLEGRSRIRPPRWWTQSLLDCHANRRYNFCFSLRRGTNPRYHDANGREEYSRWRGRRSISKGVAP